MHVHEYVCMCVEHRGKWDYSLYKLNVKVCHKFVHIGYFSIRVAQLIINFIITVETPSLVYVIILRRLHVVVHMLHSFTCILCTVYSFSFTRICSMNIPTHSCRTTVAKPKSRMIHILQVINILLWQFNRPC